MTKQLINTGTIANDKTGDPLRTAFTKINSNFTEVYSALGNGSAITLTPTVTELNYVHGVTSNIQHQLDNKLAAIQLAPVATSNSYSDLINRPALATIAVTGSYNDLVDKPSLFSGSYDDLINKPIPFSRIYSDLIGTPVFAQVAFSGNYDDLLNTPSHNGNGLQSRVLRSATATQLSNNSTQFLNVSGSRGYTLYKISSSVPAWIRVYINTTSRNNDTSRLINEDPSTDSGVVAEVITGALNQTVHFTPAIVGFNDEGSADTDIYVSVTNLSGSTADITVSLTYVSIEQ